MTNEEATKNLKKLKSYHNGSYGTAIDIAIKALNDMPTENEEVIYLDKGALKSRQGRFVIYDVEWLKENFYSTEEKIYGQPKQPSEDAVSREQVEEITFQEPSYTDPYNILTEVREKVRALPSVYPERPKGKWNFIGYQMFECPSCKSAYTQNQFEELRLYTTDDLLPKYCPNCGSYNGGEEDEVSD